jgi:phosphoglycerol transferase
MDKNFCEGVPEDYLRKTYTCVINGAAAPKDPGKTRVFSTFDLFPTMLAAIGVNIEGDRLGLGTNLYGDLPTITEQDALEKVEEEISSKSELMESMFWAEYQHPPKKTKDKGGAKAPVTTERKEQTEESK